MFKQAYLSMQKLQKCLETFWVISGCKAPLLQLRIPTASPNRTHNVS
jgi:hypothetical protein